jgi:beta-glucosidase
LKLVEIEELTNKEKIELVVGKNDRQTNDLGDKIPSVVVSDGPLGLRHIDLKKLPETYETIKSVAYPSLQVLSQTWDLDLALEMGSAIADDCIAQDVDIILAPGVNIKRNPLNGRNFEYFSEDPLLAGLFAKNYILGVQQKHVGACIKHFCCNSQEYSRHRISMEVDERTLREIYLLPFEIGIEAKPWTLMCSYNLVNGVRMSENLKLFQIARDEFGFDGVIVSDWDAVKNATKSISSSLDLIMPYRKEHIDDLSSSLNTGKLSISSLDKSASNLVRLVEKNEREKKFRKVESTKEARSYLSQRIAEKGMVLVKNDGILPLKKNQRLLVSGLPSVRYFCGGGSSKVELFNSFTSLDVALRNLGFLVRYSESVIDAVESDRSIGNVKQCFKDALNSDVTIFAFGDTNFREDESRDRSDMRVPQDVVEVIKALRKASKKLVLLVYSGAPLELSELYDLCDAMLLVGYGGERVSEAVADILSGKVNPSGKLTETYPLSYEDTPISQCYRDESCFLYSEGIDVGYRYYTTRNLPVLFPFGYGLTYSKFAYEDLKIERTEDYFIVSFNIENVSSIAGAEVAQIYVGDLTKCVYRPLRELKGFAKIHLAAHEKRRVEILLSMRSFAYYSVGLNRRRVNPGIFEISIGENVSDIKLSDRIEINEEVKL